VLAAVFPSVTRKECCCENLKLFCQALWLPPAHVWASETTGANLGIRFAALYATPPPPFPSETRFCARAYISREALNSVTSRFPQMVLSLTMLSVPSPTEYVSDVRLGCHALVEISLYPSRTKFFFFCFLQTRGILPYMR
jgi:hypothetical protein